MVMEEVPNEFETAFADWLESEKGTIKLASSKAVYRSIWGAFARSVGGVRLQNVTSEMIEAYLKSGAAALAAEEGRENDDGGEKKPLTIRYQARVARLIEKVMEHHASKTEVDKQAVSPVKALMKANPELGAALLHEASNEPELQYLSDEKYQRLKDYLITTCRDDIASSDDTRWPDMRDRASMALQLGAGLTPNDVRELTVTDLERGRWRVAGGRAEARYLRVPKNGKISERNVKVDQWAAEILDGWLGELRHRRDIGLSLYVFPGEIKPGGDGQWSRPGQHKQTTKVLEGLGIAGSSFMLRHSWALCKLRDGAKEHEVAKWLGVLDGGEVMKRYREVLDREKKTKRKEGRSTKV